jgi:hypothetical protein
VQARITLDKRLVVSELLSTAGQQSQDVVCCCVVLKRSFDKEEQEGTRVGAAFLCLANDVKHEPYLRIMTYEHFCAMVNCELVEGVKLNMCAYFTR